MKVIIEAGTRGWYEIKFNGLDPVIFTEDTTVELEHYGGRFLNSQPDIRAS
jgi:hypothetical protein